MRKTVAIIILCFLSSLTIPARETKKTSKDNNSSSTEEYTKFRFGEYGEVIASFKDYGTGRLYGGNDDNPKKSRNIISIPRFALTFDYKLNSKWVLSVEIGFESGGTDTAFGLENTENGECETEVEKGGKVAIEQFHITRLTHHSLGARTEHIIALVGLTNAHHEPINFFGVSRPGGEISLLPSTWHGNSLEIFGSFGKGYTSFNYQTMVIAGLNPNGFDRSTWAGNDKQGTFEEDNFTSPTYVLRLDYKRVPGLRVGASFCYCADAGANSDKKQTYANYGKIPIRIFTTDAQCCNKYITARGDTLYGNLGNSLGVNQANVKLSNKPPYSRLAPVARNAVSYAAEADINIRSVFGGNRRIPVIYPLVRYEYYNSQEKGEKGQAMKKRCQASMWTAGLNWYALPNLMIKAGCAAHQIGTNKVFGVSKSYNSEDEFSVGVAYIGWFIKK